MNIISDIAKKIISIGAPLLGNAIGGPIGGIIMSRIADTFGVPADQSENILSAINADPNAADKLIDLQKSIFNHEESVNKSITDDLANARNREIELAKAGKSDWVMHIIALGFIIIYAAIQIIIVFDHAEQNDIISARLQDIIVMIVSYYFSGSVHMVKNLFKKTI